MRVLKRLRNLALILVASIAPAFAQTAASSPAELAASPSAPKALTQTVNAVVGIKSIATPGARSIDTLGRERTGSGILIDTDGHVLTIGYLLIEADQVMVETDAGLKVPAAVIAYDQASGFGLVKAIAPLKLAPATIGSSARLKVSEQVLTVSGGEDGGVAAALLVSKRPFAGYWEYLLDEALFTSPARPDHSGAALVNVAGELVGVGSLLVNNAAQDTERMQGNMFIPIDLLKPILAELKAKGKSRASTRPWLGLSSTEQDGRLRVLRVSRESPAADAGVEVGDLVLAINGIKVESLRAFYAELWRMPSPDSEVELTLLKGAELRKLKVKAQDRSRSMVKPQGV
jgi:serine protease Do